MEVDKGYIREFLLGGNCSCVIENTSSGNHFEYKITRPEDYKVPMYFVKVKRGSMIYAGFIRPTNGLWAFTQGNAGQLTDKETEIQALLYVLNRYNRLPPNVVVHHLGKCSRCGMKLSDPESIQRGLGPTCLKKVLSSL